jgi:hypothetical protein
VALYVLGSDDYLHLGEDGVTVWLANW